MEVSSAAVRRQDEHVAGVDARAEEGNQVLVPNLAHLHTNVTRCTFNYGQAEDREIAQRNCSVITIFWFCMNSLWELKIVKLDFNSYRIQLLENISLQVDSPFVDPLYHNQTPLVQTDLDPSLTQYIASLVVVTYTLEGIKACQVSIAIRVKSV